MSQWEDRARELVDQIESRAAGRGTLDPDTRDYLVKEFAHRLDGARDPEDLLRRWYGSIDRYVDRTVGPPGRRVVARPVTPEDVQRQFLACSDVCPPPLGAVSSRSRSRGGYS
jgi:hypothetical protein